VKVVTGVLNGITILRDLVNEDFDFSLLNEIDVAVIFFVFLHDNLFRKAAMFLNNTTDLFIELFTEIRIEHWRVREHNFIRFNFQFSLQTLRQLCDDLLFLLREVIALFVPVVAQVFLNLQLQARAYILLIHVVVNRVEVILHFF
jgi:hypothetical protein